MKETANALLFLNRPFRSFRLKKKYRTIQSDKISISLVALEIDDQFIGYRLLYYLRCQRIPATTIL